MAKKERFPRLQHVAASAAGGALTGLVTGAQVDPTAPDSWAKTGANMLIGGVSGGVIGLATMPKGRSAHMADGYHESRR